MMLLRFILLCTFLGITGMPALAVNAASCNELEKIQKLIAQLRSLIQRNLQARDTFTSATANIKINSNLIIFDAKLQTYLGREAELKEHCL